MIPAPATLSPAITPTGGFPGLGGGCNGLGSGGSDPPTGLAGGGGWLGNVGEWSGDGDGDGELYASCNNLGQGGVNSNAMSVTNIN